VSDTATTTPMQRVTLQLGQIRVNENNVRQDLNLNERFLKSAAANGGVKVPVVLLPPGEDTYDLKMGHRRYFATRTTKDTEEEQDAIEVPAYVLDPSLREAGEDFIDQLIENDDDYRQGVRERGYSDPEGVRRGAWRRWGHRRGALSVGWATVGSVSCGPLRSRLTHSPGQAGADAARPQG
jgi:ParB family chromosome partitioning protein